MEDVWALKCLRSLQELDLQSLLHCKTLSVLSLGRPAGLCSPIAPLPGGEEMGSTGQPGRSMDKGFSRVCFSLLSTPISRDSHLQHHTQKMDAQKLAASASSVAQGQFIPTLPCWEDGCEPLELERSYSSQRGKDSEFSLLTDSHQHSQTLPWGWMIVAGCIDVLHVERLPRDTSISSHSSSCLSPK